MWASYPDLGVLLRLMEGGRQGRLLRGPGLSWADGREWAGQAPDSPITSLPHPRPLLTEVCPLRPAPRPVRAASAPWWCLVALQASSLHPRPQGRQRFADRASPRAPCEDSQRGGHSSEHGSTKPLGLLNRNNLKNENVFHIINLMPSSWLKTQRSKN